MDTLVTFWCIFCRLLWISGEISQHQMSNTGDAWKGIGGFSRSESTTDFWQIHLLHNDNKIFLILFFGKINPVFSTHLFVAPTILCQFLIDIARYNILVIEFFTCMGGRFSLFVTISQDKIMAIHAGGNVLIPDNHTLILFLKMIQDDISDLM